MSRTGLAFSDTLPPSAEPLTIPAPPLECAPTLELLPQDDSEECWRCDGHGTVVASVATFSAASESRECPVCEGTGRL